ncbi:MAG: DUF4258 domain-containing protein [Thermoflexales bacterium]|nr:DUF4258 domain-containing protein [Thermoflexales bacterium]
MKPIHFSRHAWHRMCLRGATEAEVVQTIETGPWEPARAGKYQASRTFVFGQPSPVDQKVYLFKTVHVIFAEEADRIVVVTVLVYYGSENGGGKR